MATQKKHEDLESMTRDELYEMAKEQDIPGKSGMNKEELIHALQGSQKGSSHGGGSHKSEDSHKSAGSKDSHSREDSSAPGHGGGKGDTPPPRGASREQYKNIPGNQT